MNSVCTIGHSNRTWDAFVALLRAHEIRLIADVRAQPGSRRMPHFASGAMSVALPAAGVGYRWFPGLGGRRSLQPGSDRNAAWRDAAFRAYADYLGRPEFVKALAELEGVARQQRAAILCAEAAYLKCHRQLIADTLVVRGWQVLHVDTVAAPTPHALTPFARIGSDGVLTYPSEPRLDIDVTPS